MGPRQIRMKTPRAGLAREADLVFRIAYCVATIGRNTQYAIRTMAELLNVGLTIFSPPTIILFSKQSNGWLASADTDENRGR